jgi:hypothetical protein
LAGSIEVAIDVGFSSKEIKELFSIIQKHQDYLNDKWDEYFTK